MTFEFEWRNEYGNTRYFPLNRDAKLLLDLMKRKVLHHAEIRLMRMAGWKIQIHSDVEDRD